MDVNNKHLTNLLDKTDCAFKQLLENPNSAELTESYEHAKQELDFYLHSLKYEIENRYKHIL